MGKNQSWKEGYKFQNVIEVSMTRTSASTPPQDENMTGSYSIRHEVSGTIAAPPKSKDFFFLIFFLRMREVLSLGWICHHHFLVTLVEIMEWCESEIWRPSFGRHLVRIGI